VRRAASSSTRSTQGSLLIDALHYGVSGYLLKDIGGKLLIESVYEGLPVGSERKSLIIENV
jgi:DNA-binding NarL/FixJ family response regulator